MNSTPAPRKPTPALPIDTLLPAIASSLERSPSLVIEAPPGAGKTTRVPSALLQTLPGEILVLEPRRIAARLAARRVAFELGEEVGETVGYQVRFEQVIGPRTRLRFLTEGLFTRRLLSDPDLNGIDAVVLDEFHERHLETDLALALLKRLQQRRPTLRLVVMSATLDAAPVVRFLGNCPILRSAGRLYPVAVTHLPFSPQPLAAQVRHAVSLLLDEQPADDQSTGHILVFLPGAAEIRAAARECQPLALSAGLLVLPLHGELPSAEQDRAIAPISQRKLILSTNVAESSVTIDGVTAVIDSGLARIATDSPWSGLPTLAIARSSQASATQRAGRAGRTCPGRVLRLYPEQDLRQRPEHDVPAILRSDLAQLALSLRAMGFAHLHDLTWLDPPPPAAIANAENLLNRLGVTGATASRLARFPLPPRLARLLVTALDRGVGESGCHAAALLASGTRPEAIDLLAAMDAPPDPRSLQLITQLRRLARPARPASPDDDALLLAVLAGFPDRVARRRAGREVLLSSGVSAEIAGEPPPYEFMVALDLEDRPEKPLPLIRTTARVEPEWLLDLFPERVREQSTLTWNRSAERVDAVSALLYDQLVLDQSRDAAPDPAAAAALLADKAIEAGIDRFIDLAALENLLARAAFAGLTPPDADRALRDLCGGLRSFTELKLAAANLIPNLEQALDTRSLRERAPASIRLANNRQTMVHYDPAKPPWIASRLQDFFGMHETPRLGPARSPVVVHLLAPNGRAVQTTTDLAGFWQRLYPQLRRDLMRRYPRHTWPESP